MKRELKNERGGWGGEEGNPHPLPALSLAPFFARSLILVPRSLLIGRTETLATQVNIIEGRHIKFCKENTAMLIVLREN